MAGFASQSLFGPAGSDNGMFFAHTAVATASGCAGALIAKGSCANGAITAAFANMYNKWGEDSERVSAYAFECRNTPIKNTSDANVYNYGSRDAAISKQVLEYQSYAIMAPIGGLGSFSLGSLLKGLFQPKDFFAGTRYSRKVLQQMKNGDFHSFPESVKAFQKYGRVRSIRGGDGVLRKKLETPGSYKGRKGNFEFMKEADGTINHRFFNSN